MKYFLIAGEASGDLHASNLMRQLKVYDPDADFMFLGGDLMQAQGGKMLVHYREMAYMGVWEVIANAGKVKR
ncbi:MAG: lipid-A-disaccharide synthase, partial [Bacteroidales bacterium]|nr:lipid-A-disaccharide synthase [Bacteroidales bacterium]